MSTCSRLLSKPHARFPGTRRKDVTGERNGSPACAGARARFCGCVALYGAAEHAARMAACATAEKPSTPELKAHPLPSHLSPQQAAKLPPVPLADEEMGDPKLRDISKPGLEPRSPKPASFPLPPSHDFPLLHHMRASTLHMQNAAAQATGSPPKFTPSHENLL